MKHHAISVVAAFAAVLAVEAHAAELPCTALSKELAEAVESTSSGAGSALVQCVKAQRVCEVNLEGKVFGAQAIRELLNPSSPDSVVFGVVQSAGTDEPALCLVGQFSGGSAAAWLFYGWTVSGNGTQALKGMERARLNSDAVLAKGLGNEIYRAYSRHANR